MAWLLKPLDLLVLMLRGPWSKTFLALPWRFFLDWLGLLWLLLCLLGLEWKLNCHYLVVLLLLMACAMKLPQANLY